MDEVKQLCMFPSDNPTVAEAFSAFCTLYMLGRQFTQQARRDYRYDLTEWFSQVAISNVKSIDTRSMQRYLRAKNSRY
jgi:carbamoylphosphate synthase small subunit